MTAIEKSDYEEPCCPFDTPDKKPTVKLGRVVEKLDEYMAKKDFAGAKRHLIYWIAEAESMGDLRGKLAIINEQIGLYRKSGNKEDGLNACEEALKLIPELGFENTVTEGTTLVNCATAYKAFSLCEKAMILYKKAEKIYESLLCDNDGRLGGLYNNMAITETALCNFSDAKRHYDLAIEVMKKVEGGEAEIAITYCNLADLALEEKGAEAAEKEIDALLTKAREYLNAKNIKQDTYFAFVLEKCADTFGYFGYFADQAEMSERSKKLYEGA